MQVEGRQHRRRTGNRAQEPYAILYPTSADKVLEGWPVRTVSGDHESQPWQPLGGVAKPLDQITKTLYWIQSPHGTDQEFVRGNSPPGTLICPRHC